jgi:hypothetical protein
LGTSLACGLSDRDDLFVVLKENTFRPIRDFPYVTISIQPPSLLKIECRLKKTDNIH